MARAIAECLAGREHLLVQAGTGTGKSLGYLAPVLAHLAAHPDDRVVIATATLALQAQLADSDIPHALAAMEKVAGKRVRSAVLKGRTNYACLLRVRGNGAVEQQGLFGGADVADQIRDSGADEVSVLGAEVLALREWAEDQAERDRLADRDEAPTHTARGWAQVSISSRECLGAQRCPFGAECFVEKSRERARAADLVVTNHAMLAIDAMQEGSVLPEHSAVIIDEAHELVSRVTGAASAELSSQIVERVAKRAMAWMDDDTALDLMDAGESLGTALDGAALARVEPGESALLTALAQVRDLARDGVSQLGKGKDGKDADSNERRQAQAALQEVFEVAERMATPADGDVVWVIDRERSGRELRAAPLSVAGLMRGSILSDRTAVFTSATLKVGGGFTKVAGSFGLRAAELVDGNEPSADRGPSADEVMGAGFTAAMEGVLPWRALDVGSPFDYRKQGILYLARDLPRPGRDGTDPAVLGEIAQLVWAAGGHTLGLFSSQRAAQAAAEHVRNELPAMEILLQGDAHLAELTRRFVTEPQTSLFGTLSLWQGVDVPGDTCRLVIIDKIPFPRPDEPLMQARQQEVEQHGGNGFMAVAATHAALLLAQGAGRLIRRTTDRGMVALLDPRIVTARYGSFLRASLPSMWTTTDSDVAVRALQRLAADAEQDDTQQEDTEQHDTEKGDTRGV
ncbi:ATP-dependent DNA helicase [Raineyella sp. LH-20]|uniref:ATP-dependent DNA helicase n=1 Tax=Raineyella sp. LH-20 TaxID=3081204 RepID=UPI002955B4E2|nr:ATP-dependent DNA helicase [Raineyella sp. LH-20]WOP20274.1 ATP-dependent DNA helicase [Raineyella sp. LH-20]